MDDSHNFAVVLAGGHGTRFWPASTSERPKQLLPLFPGSKQSLLEATVERLEPLVPRERILIATSADLVESVVALLPELPPENVLGEPRACNTAPSIGWASLLVRRRDPEALLAVVPSDHHVTDPESWRAASRRALASAARGAMTTLGMRPTRPETGYGYIEVGEAVADAADPALCSVLRFVEKPDRPTAEAYIADGRHLWNAGAFFFKAADLELWLETLLPDLAAGLARIGAALDEDSGAGAKGVTRDVFDSLEPISFDHGLLEKLHGQHVVKTDCGWSDLGSWYTTWELAIKDADGNAVDGRLVAVDARNNFVRDLTGSDARSGRPARTVALIGVEGLAVVQTEDALLVLPLDRAQDVRAVVDELARRKGGN